MIPTHSQSSTSGSKKSQPAVSDSTKLNITDFTIRIPDSTVRLPASEPPAARWYTPEFLFYGVAFVLVVPVIIYWPMKLSSVSHPNYSIYAGRLSKGWLFGRQVDISDPQYRSFRNNLPSLALLSGSYLLCSSLFTRFIQPLLNTTSTDEKTTRLRQRAIFITFFAGIMLLILHGASAFKILMILGLNHYLIRLEKTGLIAKAWPTVLIVGNMGTLFLNDRYDGYRFASLGASFEILDSYSGVLPRWHIGFNITMLRIISFGLDYHWRDRGILQSVPVANIPLGYRKRASSSLEIANYGMLNYLAYCLYAPLYIAGPIITFNDFIWQIRKPITIPARVKISYAIRFIFCLLTMESVLHTMYVVAIKDTAIWTNYGPADLSMIGLWNLIVVWLKLLIPWRFFRLWSLLDGMDPPENMVRCVLNNYSTLGFWRSWHRSYNLWLLRYIYIPLGGSKNAILATVSVFTFVALWHDLSFKLLAWGWLITIFIIPELTARKLITEDKYGHNWWYRHLCAAGGVANCLFMMTANLIGFVLGIDGMKYFIKELSTTVSGLTFLTFACCCLFIGVQIMMEYREEERRKGIDRKC